MNTSPPSSTEQRPVKSWLGLFLGLFFVGIQLMGWWETRSLGSVLGVLGFACFVYPWSQITSWSLKQTQPMDRPGTWLTGAAAVFLLGSLALRFWV